MSGERPCRHGNEPPSWCAAVVLAVVLYSGGAGPAMAAVEGPVSRADGDLYVAIESKLLYDGGASADQIDVGVNGGIVTLSGAVDCLLSKQRAVALTQTLPGVRSVIDLQTVHPVQRPDLDIQHDVEATLGNDPATSGWRLDVASIDGTVTLGGTVDSYAEKLLAGSLASGVPGVRKVDNDIAVADARVRPDAEIKADIQQRLKWDAWLDDFPIEVAVHHGAVTLSGTVGRVSDQRRAALLARVLGVTRVDDKTRLDWLAPEGDNSLAARLPPDDTAIAAAIGAAFRGDPRLQLSVPYVSVHAGKVVLSGAVGDYAAKQAAYQDVEDTIGVGGIDDIVKIRLKDQPADAVVSRNVMAALNRDAYLFNDEVAVSVWNGTVTLHGVVQNAFQRSHAAELAERTIGVHGVVNELTVLQPPRERRDTDIIEGIRHDLSLSRDLHAASITVAVGRGVAMLTGAVPSVHADQEAQAMAYENGAISVDDLLQILPGQETAASKMP